MMNRACLVSFLWLALLAASPTPTSSPTAPAAPAGNYAAFTKGMERSAGLFDVLKKNDAVYFDLAPDSLDRTYVIEPIVARGLGAAFTGRAFDALPLKFVRQGARILWVVPNSNFLAPNTTWAKLALDNSISDSIVGASPILAEDTVTKHVVFAPTLLGGDFADVAATLNPRTQPPPGLVLLGPAQAAYTFQGAESSVASAKAFPANVEVVANLGFGAPANAPPSIADNRGFRIVMHYSIVALPAAGGYAPREADDRVGYFVDTLKRLDDTGASTPYVRYILRWDMRKKPIVYYLTNEIPPEYRPAVKRALLAWNAAFDRIGIHDAIEVRDQPSDPNWDPDDARYSSVRWITSDTPSFGASTAFFSDPYTGQIFRSEIVIDGEYLRAVRYGFAEQVLPALAANSTLEAQSAEQALFAQMAGNTLGAHIDGATFAKQWLQSVVTHEAGHALGLRHNFAGSTLYSLAQIHDPKFSAAHGLSASVMDYLPVNISPPHVRQGAYFQLNLGPYDYWAVRYGYSTTQSPQSIARMSSRPEYRYGTDDEISGAASLDPRISAFDLSSDPLAYDAEQFDLSRAIVARLDAHFPSNDTRYYDERLAFLSVMQSYARASFLAVRYLGGEYTSRTHRGQPGGKPPFVPISRAAARQAFDLLARNVFAPDAFTFPKGLVRDLGPDYFHGWGGTYVARPDFPLLTYANSIQDTVLNQLFSTVTLGRIYDAESSTPGTDTLRLADVFEWTRNAAFDGLRDADVMSAAHRELQRHFVDLMIAYQGAPSNVVQNLGAPREAQALARYELGQILGETTRALRSNALDITTRAHLSDLAARANRALTGVNILSP